METFADAGIEETKSFQESFNSTVEEPETTPDFSDVTATVVGGFGRWQLTISILMSLLKLCSAWYQLNIIFIAPPQQFWCRKPDLYAHMSDDKWRDIRTTPDAPQNPCFIHDPVSLASAPVNYNRSFLPIVPCSKFEYDHRTFARTLTEDFDLVCNRLWLVNLTQCIMMAGILLGGVVFGALADRYGRKKYLMFAILTQTVASFVVSFMHQFWLFMLAWLFLAMAVGGVNIISFVLCMEAVSGKWRTIIPILNQLPFGLGNTFMATLAYYFRDWRLLEIALATLSSFYVLYWLCVPESPRWLIADGQFDRATDELYRAAQMNKRNEWTKESIRRLMPKKTPHAIPPTFKDYLKLPRMRSQTFLLSVNWLFTGVAFYTFAQFLGGIGRNIFITVAVTGAMSTVGPIAAVFVIAYTGRKNTIWLFQSLTAVCFAVTWIVTRVSESGFLVLAFAGIGFAAMAAFVPSLYLYTAELYPTLGRNIGVGGTTMFARIGSMMAPFVCMLDSVMEGLPLLVLAISSFGQMFLLGPLPETKNVQLPDTLEEAEQFVKCK